MQFAEPIPFLEALDLLLARGELPTTLSSADLGKLDAEVLRHAMTSARVTHASHLQVIGNLVTQIAGGPTAEDFAARDRGERPLLMSQPEARMKIHDSIRKLGFEPVPGKRGTIEDLSSDARINLQIETNVTVAQGFGRATAGNNEVTLTAFPAQELFRLIPSRIERDWGTRWVQAARAAGDMDTLRVARDQGRMIARKDSPIWAALGDRESFPDALGNSFPPFAFNSGMDVRDISFSDAVKLGLMADGDAPPNPEKVSLTRGLNVSSLDQTLQRALAEDDRFQVVDGILSMID